MQHQAEGQAAIAAEREASGFADLLRQGIEPAAEGCQRVVAAVGPVADGERVAVMGGERRQVGRQIGQAFGQPVDGVGQLA